MTEQQIATILGAIKEIDSIAAYNAGHFSVDGPGQPEIHELCGKVEVALAAISHAEGEAQPVAVLIREIGEDTWFDHRPVLPNSPEHVAAQRAPELDYCVVYTHPAPAALSHAEGEAPEGWRPIESAPLDGSHIQLYRPEIQFIGYYGGANSGWRHNAPGLEAIWPEPTHWRPLAVAPTSDVATLVEVAKALSFAIAHDLTDRQYSKIAAPFAALQDALAALHKQGGEA